MLQIQKFLETHTLKELQEKHGVYCSFSKSGHKASFNYDQLEAKENDPLSQECRGLILSADDGRSFLSEAQMINGRLNYDHIVMGKTKILAMALRRFFNNGQGSCANVNWSDPNLAIMEKLDGTLIIVYYDPFTDAWCAATRSVSEADLLMENGIYTFRTLFEKALKETCGSSFDEYTSKLDKQITYCFELTTPLNRIVCKYDDYRVTLLAARNNISLIELDVNTINSFGVPKVKTYKYSSLEELVNWVSTLNPSEHEGVVVKDSNFNRIKIKNAAYVAFSKIRDVLGTSERNCLELILLEKEDDSIPFLPQEIVDNLLKIKNSLHNFIKYYDQMYTSVRAEADNTLLNDRKTFALLVAQHKLWGAPMFEMWGGKSNNMKEFLNNSRKNGTWGDSFLDRILELLKHF